jgi:RNA-directed DNA polymerase
MLADGGPKPRRQLDRENRGGLRHIDAPRPRRALRITAGLPLRAAEPGRQLPRSLGHRNTSLCQVSRSVDPLGILASTNTITSHAINVLPGMSQPGLGAPRQFQPPVAQRDVKAKVAHCVGGVISPLLLNIALHGLEEAAGVRYQAGIHAGAVRSGSPALTRYADDLVACCHSRQQAEQVKARLAGWLAVRGLAFNEAKTRIVHLSEGFGFLGFSLRRYPNGKLIIKPGEAAVKRFRERLAREFRALRGANVTAVLARIVPITRGWCAYYRTVVSTRAFAALTGYLWKLTYKWACWTHQNKPKRWIVGRYYGKFSKFRDDRWVFGDRDTGAYLPKPAWTGIVRHTLVNGGASPDDPALAAYWADRRLKVKPPLGPHTASLLSKQDGRCGLCGENLLTPDQPPQSPEGWERWFLQVTKQAIMADYLLVRSQPGVAARRNRAHLVHATCQRRQQPAGMAGKHRTAQPCT